MAKKTFNVDALRKQVNDMLAKSTCSPDGRQGMIHVLECILHDTGNYHGFNYLTKEEVPEGQKPGINHCPDLMNKTPDERYEIHFKDTDRTRVKYY